MVLKSELHQDLPTEPLHVTLLNRFSEIAATFPNQIAYRDGDNLDHFLTFRELKRRILQVAAYLQEKGYKKGERISIALPNCCEFPVFLVGGWVAGLTTNGASVEFTHYELQTMFSVCEPSVVVTEETCLDKVLKAVDGLPSVKEIICMRTTKRQFTGTVVDMDEVFTTKPLKRYNGISFDLLNDVCHMPFSSGTTGTPKGVMLTHMNMAYMVKTALNFFNPIKQRVRPIPKKDHRYRVDQDTILLNAKLYHIMAVIVTFRYACIGVHQVMLRDFDVRKQLRFVEEFQVSYLALVSSQLRMIAECEFLDDFHLNSLEKIVVTNSSCPQKDVEKLQKRLPIVIRSGYGMTEMTCSCTMVDDGDPDTSVGKLLPQCELKVVCPETGKELGPNEDGELYFRGPTITKGYFKRENEKDKFFDHDGFLKTGDMGHFDKDGFVYVTGRLKDLIKVKGIQVSPTELEGVIFQIEGIVDCAVIGVPNETTGEAPAAFIIKRKEAALTEIQIHKRANERLADYKQITGGVFFIESLPRTMTGKVKRTVLRQLYEEVKKDWTLIVSNQPKPDGA